MKRLTIILLSASVLVSATAASARPHHRHKVCSMHHHHRVCVMR